MRILMGLPVSELSGAPMVAVRLGGALAARGLDVLLATPPRGEIAPLIEERGLAAAEIAARGSLRRTFRALLIIRRSRPAVVHVHGASSLCMSIARAARLMRVPVLWHIHEDVSFPRYQRRLGAVRRHARTVIAVAAAQVPFLPADRTVFVPNGVDTDALAPPDAARRADARDALGIPRDAFVLLSVGRICDAKGSFLLIRALRNARTVEPRLTLVMVGAGKGSDEARALAAEISDAAVRFSPPTPDLARFLYAADLLVHPTKRDNCPLVILEAMATGLPVLATPVGDIPRMLDGDGKPAGRLVGVMGELTVEELAGALIEAARGGRPARDREGARGREIVLERYRLDVQAERMIELYRGACGVATAKP
jgi:glycosyltransferase involved in cell wall biosynthesis